MLIKSTDPVSIFGRVGADAVQAGYARASTGATYHDVYYFGGSFFSEAEILHEALHTLLGERDISLNGRHADSFSLGQGGCNFLGHAIKN